MSFAEGLFPCTVLFPQLEIKYLINQPIPGIAGVPNRF
jgi:hypothetical protein